MIKIEGVAFDLEGTVVDVEFAHHQAHILSAKDVGLVLSLEDCFKYLAHFIGGPDEKVAQEICELAKSRGISADPNYVHEQKKKHYSELLTAVPIVAREGFLEFFHAIKKLGLKYAIGSLTDQRQAKVLLERSGMGKLFGEENIVLREQVKNLKPAPDVWIETAKRMGIRAENQLIFEDSPRGIQGAVTVGAYGLGMPVYNRPDIIKALIDSGAKRVFLSWTDINAEKLIDEINEGHFREE